MELPRRGIKRIYNLRYRSIARSQPIKKRAGSHLRIKKQQGRQKAACLASAIYPLIERSTPTLGKIGRG
jgi:hypothetical protein